MVRKINIKNKRIAWNKGLKNCYSDITINEISKKLKGRKIPKNVILKREKTKAKIRKHQLINGNKYYSLPKLPNKQVSEILKKAWRDGKYDNRKSYLGSYKWYSYKGQKVQGTYELRVAKVLTKLKIKYKAHPNDKIFYELNDGMHTYKPDFKILNKRKLSIFYNCEYLEPKNSYFIIQQKEKINELMRNHSIFLIDIEMLKILEKLCALEMEYNKHK